MPFVLSRLPYPRLVPTVVEDILRRVALHPDVEFIAIFGSRVFGDASERSDVDVTVSAPMISEAEWLALRLLVDEAPTLLWITLIRFEASPRALQIRNLQEGVIIYESEKA